MSYSRAGEDDLEFGFDSFEDFLQSEIDTEMPVDLLTNHDDAFMGIEASTLRQTLASTLLRSHMPPHTYQTGPPQRFNQEDFWTTDNPRTSRAYESNPQNIHPSASLLVPEPELIHRDSPLVENTRMDTGQPSEPWMNAGGKMTKHNWVYGGNYHNPQRNQGPKDRHRHYRPTFCCKCARINHGWYSLQQDGRKTCVDCNHIWGDNGSYREPPTCCNPETSASSKWSCRSVDDWCSPESRQPHMFPLYPTQISQLQNYDEPPDSYRAQSKVQ